MPDHVHFIVWLIDEDREAQGGPPPAPTAAPKGHRALGNVVGAFKTVSARSINALRNSFGQHVWQRNYFERVIRDEEELSRIRQYIRDNPLAEHDHGQSDDLAAAWEPVRRGGRPPAHLLAEE